ncbi:MAG: glycosyl hydrolase [Candidatus Sulfotelmatobacter sp.]
MRSKLRDGSRTTNIILLQVILFLLNVSLSVGQADPRLVQLSRSFAHPADDCRIMMRWWWFGPAVTKPEIKRELEQMKAAGIGGVEIATLYPLDLDNPETDFRNLKFLSDEHIEDLKFAGEEARKLGLRVDITLGSGWPYGGPHIPVTQAAGALRVETAAIPSSAASVAIPNISAGERLEAVFLAPDPATAIDLAAARLVAKPVVENGRLEIAAEAETRAALFFISSRTGMTVKRPAVGAEGFVLDHYDESAIENHLHAVGDRLMEAFADRPPYAVFSDSLEDYGSDWTPDLLREFQRRRGYDLTPHLPALVGDAGLETAAVRHDWGKTLTELANEHYLQPLHAWAAKHHTLLRSQSYGYPPVTLSSNQYEDLPEGEGKGTLLMWRQFSDTRWAASAGHLFGKPVISSETWTWLHSPAFRATPLDMKAEADLHFLQGINQLVGHGWPYSPAIAGEPGWRMYAAGAFNAHDPWWFAMSDLASYLQRVSFAMRQGRPANDVALLLPNDDAWAKFTAIDPSAAPANAKRGISTHEAGVSVDESMGELLGSKVIPQVLDAGYNLDFIDADAIDKLGISYPVLILPGVERLPAETYRKIEQYATHGGIVIATRRLPSTAPGLLNADAETGQVQAISEHLFQSEGSLGHLVEDENRLGAILEQSLAPDLTISPRNPDIGFIHRKLESGDLYFLANTGNTVLRVSASFRVKAKRAELWDPFTGRISALARADRIDLTFQPYESRLIFLTNSAIEIEPEAVAGSEFDNIDLSSDWNVTFEGLHQTIHMSSLQSWTDEDRFRYYSGRAVYEKTIELPEKDAGAGKSVILDFGEGAAVAKPNPLPTFNMRAYFQGPVREAAEVYVNGERAGVVWHPPYRIDLSSLVKPGKNELRIVVGNTAINSLAGTTLPDYRLLNERYGERFVPQDMGNLRPVPSGLLGSVRLRVRRR